MNKNQKGFGAVEGLLILVIVALLGGIGLFVWNRVEVENRKKASQQESKDSSISIDAARIKFTYPKNWTVSANSQSDSDAYVALDAQDGFQLGFLVGSVASLRIVSETQRISDLTVQNIIPINPVVGNLLIYSDSTGRFGSIALNKKDLKVGDKIYAGNTFDSVLNNPSKKNTYVAVNGGYTENLNSLSEFNNKGERTIKELKEILSSINYY